MISPGNRKPWYILFFSISSDYTNQTQLGNLTVPLGAALFTSQMFDGLDVATVTDMIDNGAPIQGYTGAYKRVNLWTIYAFQSAKNL